MEEKKHQKEFHTIFSSSIEGSRQGFFRLVTNPASVGVPGTPLLLEEMHARFGQLDWSELHDDANNFSCRRISNLSSVACFDCTRQISKEQCGCKKILFFLD